MDEDSGPVDPARGEASPPPQTAPGPDRQDTGDSAGSRQGVTMSKGAYRGLVATAIVGIAAGAFFAGYLVALTAAADSDDYVTWSQLREMLPSGTQQAGGAVRGAPPQKLVVSADDDPVIGSPDAPVTIVEFSDFECPFCSRFYRDTLPQIMSTYVETGAVKIVYRDYPIYQIHPNARITHIAAECADEQDGFWPYHDVLFERQSEWNKLGPADARDRMIEYAGGLSLDAGRFESCLSDPGIAAEIDADREQGGRYGVTGTPAFFIGDDESGYVLVGGAKPFASFAQVIDQKLRT